jgi:crotonobetainyl-CoA:carnitine CoA-transferase CaiB-like acyl-CoA transferase
VEVDLMTTLLSALTNQAASTLATGAAPPRLGNAHPSIAPYEVFIAADRRLVIAVGNDRQFAALAEVLGMPSLADDERFARNESRVHNRELLRSTIQPVLDTRDAADWVSQLSAARVPAGLVNAIDEAFEFADSLGLNAVAEISLGARSSLQVANPIHLSTGPVRYTGLPPMLGEHGGADWHPSTNRPPAQRPNPREPS